MNKEIKSKKDPTASTLKRFVMCIKKLVGVYKPKITLEYGANNKEEQVQEILCYKDGEYSHTVRMQYFTREQLE